MNIILFTGYDRDVLREKLWKYRDIDNLVVSTERWTGMPETAARKFYDYLLYAQENYGRGVTVAAITQREGIANLIGAVIDNDKKISVGEAKVCYCYKNGDTGWSEYSEEGYLTNEWPVGFFNTNTRDIINQNQ